MPKREPPPPLSDDLSPLARSLAENIRALLDAAGPEGKGPGHLYALTAKIAEIHEIEPSIPIIGRASIRRARDGVGSVLLNTVEAIAAAYELPAYLLLFPGLSPEALPDLSLTEAERKELERLRAFAQITLRELSSEAIRRAASELLGEDVGGGGDGIVLAAPKEPSKTKLTRRKATRKTRKAPVNSPKRNAPTHK